MKAIENEIDYVEDKYYKLEDEFFELVEKATSCAGKIPLKKKLGLLFRINLTAIVYITISENKPIISVIE